MRLASDSQHAAGDQQALHNERLLLSFSTRAHVTLEVVRHLQGDWDLVHPLAAAPLWTIDLRNAAGEIRTIASTQPGHVVAHETRSDGIAGLVMEWRTPLNDGTLHVIATIDLPDGSALPYWRFSVTTGSQSWVIWKVVFPCLAGIGAASPQPEADMLSLPFQSGLLIHNPEASISRNPEQGPWWLQGFGKRKVENNYPNLFTMQFFTYCTGNGAGLYLATHDAAGYLKSFGFYGEDESQGLAFTVTHYPPHIGPEMKSYTIPYPVVIGVFDGDWQAGAEIYRSWASQQTWRRLGHLQQRSDSPRWLKDLDLWAWNDGHLSRSRPDEVVPGALALQAHIGSPVAVHWSEWHERVYDFLYPDYTPNTARSVSLRHYLALLHDHGKRAVPYVNGRLWSTSHPGWPDPRAQAAFLKDERGAPYVEPWPAETFTPVCPTSSFWAATMVETLVDLVIKDLGFDGAYVDQIASYMSLPCFDRSHGHSIGGGTYWSDGYHRLMVLVRDEARRLQPEAIFTSEGCCEVFLDSFDAFLTLDGGNLDWQVSFPGVGAAWEPIPLFNSVYHDYALTYGTNRGLTSDSSSMYVLEQARSLAWGSQPVLEGYFPEQSSSDGYGDDFTFMRQIVAGYRWGRRYLQPGRWVRGLTIESPQTWVARGPRPEDGRLVPAVLASAWRADGRILIVLINISMEPVQAHWRLPGLPKGSILKRRHPAAVKTSDVSETSDVCSTITLAARQVVLLEIATGGST